MELRWYTRNFSRLSSRVLCKEVSHTYHTSSVPGRWPVVSRVHLSSLEVCHEGLQVVTRRRHPGAVLDRSADGARAERKTRARPLPDCVQCASPATLRPRRGPLTLVLVRGSCEGVHHRHRD